MNRKLAFSLLLGAFAVSSWAQQAVTVKGTVKDAENNPVIGATVVVKGTTIGTTTDIDGNYTINVTPGQVLEFSYVGMQQSSVTVGNKNVIDITMADGELLDEVVVIGYGTVKKSHLTGAVSSVSGKELQANVARTTASALQGRVPGVTVSANTGQPGSGMTINIRGVSSLQSTTPLYVIDGVYGDINMVDPSDIQSIEVLKDASAAAIYGSRAANGVVLITTKGGRKDMPTKVTVDAYTGIQMVAKKYDVMDGDQYRDFAKIYNINQSVSELTGWQGKGTDWQDELFEQANVSKVNLNVTGGSKTATFNVSGSYLKQDGIVKTTGYEAWNLRTKNTFSFFNNHVRVGNTFLMKFAKKDFDDISFSELLNVVPQQSVYDENNSVGHWGTTPSWAKAGGNPVGWAEAHDRQKHSIDLMLNGWAEVDLYLEGLKYKFNVGLNKYTNRNYTYIAPYYFSSAGQNLKTQLDESTGWQNEWLIENTINYDKVFGKHTINAVVGYSAQQNEWRGFGAGRDNLPEGLYVIDTGDSSTSTTSGSTWRESMVSMFARAMYSYDDRYMASLSIRRDGSSKFNDVHKWGNFPSVSVGWRFSDEKFMKFSKKFLEDGKIRASFGITGNEAIGNYDYIYSYSPNSIYDGVGGVIPTRIGKDNLKWEETKQFNLGLDLNFWNSRLTITADYYDKYTDGLLANYQLPKESGFAYMKTNVGEMSNRGFEIAVTGDIIRTKDWKWNASFNISRNINRIEKLSEGKAYMEGDIWWMQEGGRVGDFYGFKSAGVFAYDESNAFTDKWEQLTPVFENGVFQYKYLLDGKEYAGNIRQKTLPNGKPFRGGDYNWEEPEGTRDGVIDDNDRMVIGNAMPDVTGGLNTTVTWKNLSLYLGFYYSLGGQIYNAAEHNRNMFKYTGTTPSPEVIHNMWLHPGDQAIYPRPYNDDYNNARMGNSFYLEDASFIRLQNIRVAYDLPENWIKKLMLKNINIYAFVNNALTWTNYSGFDPEFSTNNPLQVGKDSYRYPRKREYGIGFSANF